ncbi:MAG: hypothetical protein JWM76_5223 [Pseudonocardiales bacterium]|nr:hypothetical protein [Pseudonocardiales bacterium]
MKRTERDAVKAAHAVQQRQAWADSVQIARVKRAWAYLTPAEEKALARAEFRDDDE